MALSVVDQGNAYAWVAIRGRVVELTHENADEHIDRLSKKYLGRDSYPARKAGEQRVIVKIEPEHVASMGTD